MLSKEKCEKAIDNVARYCSDYKLCMIPPRFELTNELEVLMDLIKEHFELVEKIKWLKEEMTEPAFNLVFSTQEFLHNWYKGIQMYSSENAVLQRKVSEYENPQPYKLEDLKASMFVFDCIKNRVNKIIEIFEADYGIPYIKFDDGFGEWFIVEFEENRFFPLTKALEYQK